MRNLILAIAACLLPAAAFAGGYVVPNTNPRDLAMGGSAIAAQNNAAATFANPAALSRLDGFSISVADSLIDFRSTFTDTTHLYDGGSTTMTPKGVFPPAIYAAYGTKLGDMGFGVGAGLTIPGGGYVFWPDNWIGKGDIISVDRKVYGMYLTAGIQPIPGVRLGGGLVYYRTTEHLVQGLNLLGQQGAAEIATAGGALSYDLSAEITPVPDLPLTVGIDYKHQGVQTLEGHAHFDNVPDALRPNLLDQTATHVLTYPNQLNVGASFRPIEPLLITAGWTWERFHVYKDDVFQGTSISVVVPRDYKNGYTLRLGGEYAVIPALKVRAGILRDISPSRAEALSASLPDASSWAGSVGLGFEVIPNLEVNAAYFYDKQDLVDSTRPELPGSFDTRANIFSIGLAYNFGGPNQKKK